MPENIVVRFLAFLVEMADQMLQYEGDAIQLIHNKVRSSEIRRRSAATKMARDAPETITTNVIHLLNVYKMLTEMGLTDEQAKTVLIKFCYDEKISVQTITDLSQLYREYNELIPFTTSESTSYPELLTYHNIASKEEKRARFYMIVQSCLPANEDVIELETYLTETADMVMEGKLKRGILTASGLIEPTNSTTHINMNEANIPVHIDICERRQPVDPRGVRRQSECGVIS